MPENPPLGAHDHATTLSREVGAQEERKLAARRVDARAVWSGFGMFGLIGWSVAAPTVIGALAGVWLDKRGRGVHSWTLALLIVGLAIGCFNAWHWVSKEDRDIHSAGGEDID
ncbi:MAG TPA: AtpZ/AtpI family protein [Steroidobacteraceae bacterium]